MSIKNKDLVGDVDHSISLSDLQMIEGFNAIAREGCEESFEKILFDNGFDTSKGIDIVQCLHRNLQNKVVDTFMYFGWERLDDVWIATGAASMEATIASTRDPEMKFDLRTMSAQRNQDKVFD